MAALARMPLEQSATGSANAHAPERTRVSRSSPLGQIREEGEFLLADLRARLCESRHESG